jgi:hypothetical protein
MISVSGTSSRVSRAEAERRSCSTALGPPTSACGSAARAARRMSGTRS